jgi:hypothetical protein
MINELFLAVMYLFLSSTYILTRLNYVKPNWDKFVKFNTWFIGVLFFPYILVQELAQCVNKILKDNE